MIPSEKVEEIPKKQKKVKYSRDIPAGYRLITDSQDVEEIIKDLLPKRVIKQAIEDIQALFVNVRDGDYVGVYLSLCLIQYPDTPVWDIFEYYDLKNKRY